MIEILGKLDCDPCSQLKMVLEMNDKEYTFFDAMQRGIKRAVELKAQMAELGIREIPAVWVNGAFVGSGDKIVLGIKDYL